MKPNEGNYAAQALKWGVAGLAIDLGRIACADVPMGRKRHGGGIIGNATSYELPDSKGEQPAGRFPANIILSCACESAPPHEPGCACAMLDEQSGVESCRPAKAILRGATSGSGVGSRHRIYQDGFGGIAATGYTDTGGASRFFKQIHPDQDDSSPDAECRMRYHSKASRTERDAGLEDMPVATPGEITGGRKEGSAGLDSPRAGAGRTSGGRNTHATVKPLDLMRYLCRLTATPTGGLVLDPYAGSGTTGLAAVMEGRDCVLIEREPEYVIIAKLRTGAEGKP